MSGQVLLKDNGALRRLSLIEDWLEFGVSLKKAISEPEKYGMQSADELLAAVANFRGKKVLTLQSSIEASEWLEANHIEVYSSRPAKIGMTIVLQLKKITAIDSNVAGDIEERVLSGKMGQIALKETYHGIINKSGTVRSPAIAAKQRAEDFHTKSRDFIHQYSVQLFGPAGEIWDASRSRQLINVDFVVKENGLIVHGVEVRSYRSRVHRQNLIELLGMLALAQKIYSKVLFIVPEESDHDLREMQKLSEALKLKGIRLASLPEAGGDAFEDMKFA